MKSLACLFSLILLSLCAHIAFAGTHVCYVAKLTVDLPTAWIGQSVNWTLVADERCSPYGCNYPLNWSGEVTNGSAALFSTVLMQLADGYTVTYWQAANPSVQVSNHFVLPQPTLNTCYNPVPIVSWQLALP